MSRLINEVINKINVKSLNGSDLAYIGDAYYELYIRSYLLSKGIRKPNDLHNMCKNYVCAKTHAIIINNIMDKLTEEEIDAFHRGKNYNYKHTNKSANLTEYLLSSGFEALIGYLYINNKNDRLDEILGLSVKIIEELN